MSLNAPKYVGALRATSRVGSPLGQGGPRSERALSGCGERTGHGAPRPRAGCFRGWAGRWSAAPGCVPRATASLRAVHPRFLGAFSGASGRAQSGRRAKPWPRRSARSFAEAGEADVSWGSWGRGTSHTDLEQFGKNQNKQEEPPKPRLQRNTSVLSSV